MAQVERSTPSSPVFWMPSRTPSPSSLRTSSPLSRSYSSLPRTASMPLLQDIDDVPNVSAAADPLRTQTHLCPICIEPILINQDVITLGCRGGRPNSTPHQIHTGQCLQEWLNASSDLTGVTCPVCCDQRSEALASMTPGGAYQLSGAVRILVWPYLRARSSGD